MSCPSPVWSFAASPWCRLGPFDGTGRQKVARGIRHRAGTADGGATDYAVGTFARSASHAVAAASLGIRQSPRGLIVPPALTFGPLGSALRLNWLAKKRRQNTSSQCRIPPRSYAVRRSGG